MKALYWEVDVAVCFNVLQCVESVAMCCNVLRKCAYRRCAQETGVLQGVAGGCEVLHGIAGVLQCVVRCCRVLQGVECFNGGCCRALICVAVCCNVLQ